MTVQVEELWRYPVKSLAGESPPRVELTRDGVEGDRQVHVRNHHGVVTGRTRPGLLTLPASTGADGEVLVAGQPWRSAEAGRLVVERAGPGAELAAYAGPERFDVANLLVATDGELAAFAERHGASLDRRRLRPNIVLSGVPFGATDDWPGTTAIAIGAALIGVHSPRARCIVTSIDPATGEQDLDVFRRIRQDFGGLMALNCWVIRPGTVRVGDRAELVPTTAWPAHLGGWITGVPYRREVPLGAVDRG